MISLATHQNFKWTAGVDIIAGTQLNNHCLISNAIYKAIISGSENANDEKIYIVTRKIE